MAAPASERDYAINIATVRELARQMNEGHEVKTFEGNVAFEPMPPPFRGGKKSGVRHDKEDYYQSGILYRTASEAKYAELPKFSESLNDPNFKKPKAGKLGNQIILPKYLPHPGGIKPVPMNEKTGLPEPYEIRFPPAYLNHKTDPEASWATFMLHV